MLGLRSPFWEAVGIISGMIIGSGMFVLPYAVSVSGFWGALIGGTLAFFAVLSVHLAYGEIVVNSPESHRLPGYTTLYLGKLIGNFEKFVQILGFNIALLVYGTLGGLFLSIIFGGSVYIWALVFFGVGGVLLFLGNIEKIGFVNFLLAIPLVGAILWISFLSIGKGEVANISLSGEDPFFAFGIFVFSLTGLSVIADAYGLFKGKEGAKKLRSSIMFGTSMPMVLYIIFIIAILMVSGVNVSRDAVTGLSDFLGSNIVVLGAVIAVLAMFTSFLALGFDLKKIYELDVGVHPFLSWVLIALLPILLFVSGANNFIKLIAIMGGIFIAFDGIFVVLILRKMRALGYTTTHFLHFGKVHQIALILIFIASIAYSFIYQVF